MSDDPFVFSSEQVVALSTETNAVVELLRRGIQELRELDGANDFVHLPLQLLAQGTERLLKLTVALAMLERDNAMPARSVFKSYSHDIVKLCDDLVEVARVREGYISRPAARADLEFLAADPELRRILRLLTTFGSWSRYFSFEQFLSPSGVNAEDDPDQEWRSITMEIIAMQPEGSAALLTPASGGEAHRRVAAHVTSLLEQFARALTRMWTLGAVHPEAKRHSGTLGAFLFLRDDDLGVAPPRE